MQSESILHQVAGINHERILAMARKSRRSKPGKKHRIIFVTHSMNRVWRNLLFAAAVVWIVWWSAPYTGSIFSPPNDFYLEYAGYVLLGLMLLIFLLRNQAWIQAREKHVVIRVPFFRLRIPYANIENVRMSSFRELHRGVALNWSARRFLKPYFRTTVAALLLKKYPIPPVLLRIFMPNYVFLPKGTGFMVLIKDYIGFNTEVDSRLSAARGTFVPDEVQTTDPDDAYAGYFNQFDG